MGRAARDSRPTPSWTRRPLWAFLILSLSAAEYEGLPEGAVCHHVPVVHISSLRFPPTFSSSFPTVQPDILIVITASTRPLTSLDSQFSKQPIPVSDIQPIDRVEVRTLSSQSDHVYPQSFFPNICSKNQRPRKSEPIVHIATSSKHSKRSAKWGSADIPGHCRAVLILLSICSKCLLVVLVLNVIFNGR